MTEEINASELYACENIRLSDRIAVFGSGAPAFQLVVTADSPEVSAFDFEYFKLNRGQELKEFNKNNGEPVSHIAFGLILRVRIKNQISEALSDSVSTSDLEAVVEKKLNDFLNLISGISHEHIRDEIKLVVGKNAVEEGLTFEKIENFLSRIILTEFPFIESVDAFISTDSKSVEIGLAAARRIYKARDERALSLKDENVSRFYGCKICQNGVPAHVCVITPDRPSVCSTINWFEAGASCLANPDGPIFEIEKGALIDDIGGEYTGVNEAVQIASGGENERVSLYSLLENPHTTGAVFDIIAFYIPEVGGIGLIDRKTRTPTVNWMTFEEMADFTGYGTQISGFAGVGKTYLFSDKFLQKEGGWGNVVWMSKSLKDEMLAELSSEIRGGGADEKFVSLRERIQKIPTEEDVSNTKELAEMKN